MREITERYGGYYGPAPGVKGVRMLLPAGYLAAIFGALLVPSLRARRVVRILAGVAMGNALLLARIDGSKQLQYLIYIVPAAVALLAAVLWYLRARWPVIAVVVLLQLGPVLYRVRLDKFHQSFDPAVEALRPLVNAGRPAMVDLQFAMALSYPGNLASDIHYAYLSGRTPDVIQVDHEVFDGNLPGLESKDAAEGVFLRKLLTGDFRAVWDNGAYGIYVRR